MANLNHIEQLIQDLCPSGVDYSTLGEACYILDSKRKPVSKNARLKGKCPYYGANGILDYVSGYSFDGTYLLVGEDGSVINEDNSPVLHWAEGQIWVNNHAHVLDACCNLSLQYICYFINAISLAPYVTGTAQPKMNQENMNAIWVPLPPLAEQKRIVARLEELLSLCEALKS